MLAVNCAEPEVKVQNAVVSHSAEARTPVDYAVANHHAW
jgi:hypothetical protein